MLPSMPKVLFLGVLLASCTTAIVATMPSAATADIAELRGEKSIYLVETGGTEHKIGKVSFAGENGGSTAISVELDDSRFAEKFLSMRPFRCIDGTKQTVCHLPYPYSLKDRITSGDLSDLEYRLLFLHKGPTDYGIDAWNGIYYKLSISNPGQVDGELHEADFNVLAVPPEKPFARPLGTADLEAGEPGRHRFPKLIIR
jgi:hypothetical protein